MAKLRGLAVATEKQDAVGMQVTLRPTTGEAHVPRHLPASSPVLTTAQGSGLRTVLQVRGKCRAWPGPAWPWACVDPEAPVTGELRAGNSIWQSGPNAIGAFSTPNSRSHSGEPRPKGKRALLTLLTLSICLVRVLTPPPATRQGGHRGSQPAPTWSSRC